LSPTPVADPTVKTFFASVGDIAVFKWTTAVPAHEVNRQTIVTCGSAGVIVKSATPGPTTQTAPVFTPTQSGTNVYYVSTSAECAKGVITKFTVSSGASIDWAVATTTATPPSTTNNVRKNLDVGQSIVVHWEVSPTGSHSLFYGTTFALACFAGTSEVATATTGNFRYTVLAGDAGTSRFYASQEGSDCIRNGWTFQVDVRRILSICYVIHC
jgi:hypothetical protein